MLHITFISNDRVTECYHFLPIVGEWGIIFTRIVSNDFFFTLCTHKCIRVHYMQFTIIPHFLWAIHVHYIYTYYIPTSVESTLVIILLWKYKMENKFIFKEREWYYKVKNWYWLNSITITGMNIVFSNMKHSDMNFWFQTWIKTQWIGCVCKCILRN